MLKKIIWSAIIFVAVWACAYAAVWLYRSGCMAAFTMACLNAPATPLADFIMLDWVADYQDLLAGVITTIGAGVALLALYVQREWQIAEATQNRRQAAINSLNWTYMLFKSCSESAMRKSEPELRRDIEHMRNHIEALSMISPGAADLVRTAVSSFEFSLARPDDLYWIETKDGEDHLEWPVMKYISVLASLFAAFFDEAERLVSPEGQYRFVVQTDAKARQALWRDSDISYKKLPFMRELFA